MHDLDELLEGVAALDPPALKLPLVVNGPASPAAQLGVEAGGGVTDACAAGLLAGAANHAAERPAFESGLVKDPPRRDAIEVADLLVERCVGLPAAVRHERVFVDEAVAATAYLDIVVRGDGAANAARHDFGIIKPAVDATANLLHMPQVCADLLRHADTVAGVVLPAVETAHGVALEVLGLQVKVELETARAQTDALAGLHGFLRLVFANKGVGTEDLLGDGVLDELLVMAVKENFDAAVLDVLVEDLKRGNAPANALADVHLVEAGEEVVLSACRVAKGVLDAVLVGVVGVLNGLISPCLAHVHGRLAVESLEGELGSCVGVVRAGPLAHVDGRASAATEGRLLEEHDLGTLVIGNEAGPLSCAAIADYQNVSLIIPGCGQPRLVGVRGTISMCRGGCYSRRNRRSCRARHKAPTRDAARFFHAILLACLTFPPLWALTEHYGGYLRLRWHLTGLLICKHAGRCIHMQSNHQTRMSRLLSGGLAPRCSSCLLALIFAHTAWAKWPV